MPAARLPAARLRCLSGLGWHSLQPWGFKCVPPPGARHLACTSHAQHTVPTHEQGPLTPLWLTGLPRHHPCSICSGLLGLCQYYAHQQLARDLLLHLLPAHWHDELARQRSECLG